MSKPQWLKDRESGAKRETAEPDFCVSCAYYGPAVKNVRHKNKEWVELHECDIHPKCYNTKYSICCDDFDPVQLV